MDLSKIDPNVVIVAGSLLSAFGSWLWAKIRGEQHAGLSEAIWPIVEGVALKLAESQPTADLAREKLTAAAWAGLARMGIKRSTLVEGIVAKLVERGVTEVRKRVTALVNAQRLDTMLTSAAAVRDALTPPAVPTVPPLELPTATIMCPLPGCNQVKDHDTPHGIVTGATL